MERDQIEHVFEHKGVRLTAVRQLVWKTVSSFDFVFSLGDIEAAIPSLDKSSVFRTLKTFEEHEMLHPVDDGTGVQKYCVCDCDDEGCDAHHHHHSFHVHLTCENCHKTFCLKSQKVPEVTIPSGFIVESVSYVVKGLCPSCAATLHRQNP